MLNDTEDGSTNSLSTSYKTINSGSKKVSERDEDGLGRIDSLHPVFKKILGFSLGVMSGIFYGLMFLPIDLMTTQSHNNTYYSSQSLDYAFPYTTGIFLMATLLLVVYSVKLNKTETKDLSTNSAAWTHIGRDVGYSYHGMDIRQRNSVQFNLLPCGDVRASYCLLHLGYSRFS